MLMAGLLTGSAQAQGKIATIDLRKVFDGYWKTKQADGTVKERVSGVEKEYKARIDDFRKTREDYQAVVTSAADQAVSQEERDRRKRSAEDKLRELKDQEERNIQYERDARQTIEDLRRRLHKDILTDIRGIVNARAKSGSFSLVLDASGESFNQAPILLYTNNENDLTDEVLKQLNATAPTDFPKGEPKQAEPAAEKK
jgi:Skp family chaperone for outer membrane proteins